MNTLKRVLLVGVASGTAIAAGAGPHFGPGGRAQKIAEINGNDPDLNRASQDGCPIPPYHGGRRSEMPSARIELAHAV